MAKIVAVVALDGHVQSGGAPAFIVDSKEEQEKMAFTLEKIMDATVHDLGSGLYILVDHTVASTDE